MGREEENDRSVGSRKIAVRGIRKIFGQRAIPSLRVRVSAACLPACLYALVPAAGN